MAWQDGCARTAIGCPSGAEEILVDYVARGMRFFLARVDLEEQSKLGYSYLRPLQMAFESEDFVLPLRLGMANAAEPQELVVYMLTRDGRVESVNYPAQTIPSEVQLPLFVKDDGRAFYDAMLEAEAARTQKPAVFLEYAWELSRCDPCNGTRVLLRAGMPRARADSPCASKGLMYHRVPERSTVNQGSIRDPGVTPMALDQARRRPCQAARQAVRAARQRLPRHPRLRAPGRRDRRQELRAPLPRRSAASAG